MNCFHCQKIRTAKHKPLAKEVHIGDARRKVDALREEMALKRELRAMDL